MPRSSSPAADGRVLVVAPNWLGDVVMTTPLLSWLDAVRRAPGGPSLHIALAVRAAWAPLFAGDERCDELIVVQRPGRHDRVAGIVRQAAQWRAGGFAAALLGPPSLRAALTAALAGIPRRVGRRGDGRDALLTKPLERQPRGNRHFSVEMVDLGLALAEASGWDRTHLPPPESAGPARLLRAGVASPPLVSPHRPVWAVGPGTTYGPAKTWPVGPMASFLSTAVTEDQARIVLLGDRGAAPLVAALRGSTPSLRWAAGPHDDADVVDLTGSTSLPEAVGRLLGCELYVGNDSGLMHVAAALGVPTVGLFGSSNPDWTRPSGARVAVVAADGFACRPCYRRTCNQPVFCLETVGGRQVCEVARRLLAAGNDTGAASKGQRS